MGDFLAFRRMITPIIIQIVFWIGVVACVVGGFVVMFVIELPGPKGQQFFSGLALLLLGPLVVRVYCEILIVIFRMNESLTDIRNNTARPRQA
jgi:hypothetical protein